MEEAWEVIWFKEAWYPERLMTYPRPHSSWGKQQSQREAEWQSRDPRMHLTLDTYHTCFWPWAKDVMFWRPSFFICEAVGTWHMVDSLRISVPFPPSYWDFLASLESNGGQDRSVLCFSHKDQHNLKQRLLGNQYVGSPDLGWSPPCTLPLGLEERKLGACRVSSLQTK